MSSQVRIDNLNVSVTAGSLSHNSLVNVYQVRYAVICDPDYQIDIGHF